MLFITQKILHFHCRHVGYRRSEKQLMFILQIVCTLCGQNVGFVMLDCVWNVTTYAQKPDFVFRGKGRVHLNRRERQFIRLLAADLWALAVVMLNTPCSEVVWRVMATHSIRQFPLHFPFRAPQCAITFQLESTAGVAYHKHCVLKC